MIFNHFRKKGQAIEFITHVQGSWPIWTGPSFEHIRKS